MKSRLLVQALLRLSHGRGTPAFQRRRGDPDAGAVLVKLDGGPAGCVVLAQGRTGEGAAAWVRITGTDPVDAATAEAALARQATFDPDLWIIEIEDPSLTPPLAAPMV